MPYAIEKKDAEWIVFAGGAAILRCARADMALEITRLALELLSDIHEKDAGEKVRENTLDLRRYG